MEGDQIERMRKKCIDCGKTFKNNKTLMTHKGYYHSNKPKVTNCSLCEAVFSTVRSLNGHLKRAHSFFPCSQCEKIYRSRTSLLLHEYNHTGELKFICNINQCNKAFLNPRRLYDHQRVHSCNTLKFVCEFCGYRTRINMNLIVHKRKHTGERPYCCEVCGKCFCSHHQLTEHKFVHSNDRAHGCSYCGVQFVHAKALYHHMNLHSDIKKYICNVCAKSYSQSSGYSAHMRRHREKDQNCMTAKTIINN